MQVGLQKIAFGNLSSILLLKSLLLVLLHMSACYCFIYILLPRYLLTKKYLLLSAGIIFLTLFLLITGYFIHQYLFPLIDLAYHYNLNSGSNTIWWANINSGLLNAPKVIAAATAIKFIKRWYLKQKETERLEKEKLITDLQLMKAQIRPGFLFNSLNQIYISAQKKSPDAPELLLKLSDLLSYLLYDCDSPKVSLEKELTMMKEYMTLEKARYGNKLDLEIVIRGDLISKNIAPLLLLPFIENSFKHCNKSEPPWINFDIIIENEILSMKLLNGVSLTDSESDVFKKEVIIVEKRLQLLYPGKYELKQYAEHEIYVVLLKINIGEEPESKSSAFSAGLNNQIFKNKYAVQ
jgi:sensor histidine kinase YesM